MAPVSFNDISKTAADILNNDYQTSGYQFKSKQKTSWNGAVVTSAVDLWPGKDGVQTPGKLTWKIPNPVGLMGFSIDKFEMDKSGKFKFESSLDKTMHKVDGLKIDVKSDLQSLDKVNTSFTYTALKDKRLQVDVPVTKPEAFTAEATQSIAGATVGVKLDKNNFQQPDLGVRFASGPLFAALLATKKLSTFTAFASYNAKDNLKFAASCEPLAQKGVIGLEYSCCKDVCMKAKAALPEQSLSASVKYDLKKGFSVTAGGNYSVSSGKYSYGLALSVE